MRLIHKRTLVWIVIALWVAAAARLYRIDDQSIWFDEGWSAYAAAQPSFIDAWNADATNPPLYYALLHSAARFIGTSEFSLRFFSFAWSMIATALAARLAFVLFGRQARLWALWAAALSAPLWWAAQEARMYTFMAALVALAALAWTHLQRDEKPRRVWWIALWLSELALLYTHNTGLVVALWLNAVTLIAWVVRGNAKHPEWRAWIAGQVVVGLVWLPYFVTRFLALGEANSAITSAPTGQLFVHLWGALWFLHGTDLLEALPLFGLSCFILSIVALVVVLRMRWLTLHIALLALGVAAGLLVLGNDFHARYLIMLAPVVAAGIGGERSALLRWCMVALLLGSIIVSADKPHDDARTLVQHYADTLTADDTVLAWSYADRYELAYYWDRLSVTAKRVTLPEGEDLEAILPLLPISGDVALNVWYTQRADYRGMMDCLLSSGTALLSESSTVAGMSSVFYRQPDIRPPEWNAVAWTFSASNGDVAQINAIGTLYEGTADRPLCIPLELTPLRDLSVDLKARLIVRNEFGWELPLSETSEAIFADAAQRTTAIHPEGKIRAFALLRLPPGTPPGEYAVYLRLYDEAANRSGYLPPPSGEIAYGRDLRIGTWTVTPGATWDGRIESSISYSFADDLTLIAVGAPECPARNGDEIRLALTWRGMGARHDWTLTTADGAQTIIPPNVGVGDIITRDERAIRIPSDAPSGEAIVTLPDGYELMRCQIDAIPMLTDAPPFDHAADADFRGIGTLIGWTTEADRNTQLVWRASGASDVSYTVFVQMIDAAGNVVAQSDAPPAGGTRPTTGWRDGEYIADRHTLTSNVPTFSGAVTLIAGLYNAMDGTRVRLADGADHVVLMEGWTAAWE